MVFKNVPRVGEEIEVKSYRNRSDGSLEVVAEKAIATGRTGGVEIEVLPKNGSKELVWFRKYWRYPGETTWRDCLHTEYVCRYTAVLGRETDEEKGIMIVPRMKEANNGEYVSFAEVEKLKSKIEKLMEHNRELKQVAECALEYIDAIPDDIQFACTMPGFDRDWADETVAMDPLSERD